MRGLRPAGSRGAPARTSRRPWRHVQLLGQCRAEALVELVGEDEEPIGGGAGAFGEEISESGNPLRPLLPAREVGNGVGRFSDRRDNRRDLMERVVAGALQDLGAAGAAIVESAMP